MTCTENENNILESEDYMIVAVACIDGQMDEEGVLDKYERMRDEYLAYKKYNGYMAGLHGKTLACRIAYDSYSNTRPAFGLTIYCLRYGCGEYKVDLEAFKRAFDFAGYVMCGNKVAIAEGAGCNGDMATWNIMLDHMKEELKNTATELVVYKGKRKH